MAAPPDPPIKPTQFTAEMGSGAWIIMRGPLSSKKARPTYHPGIPKILKANGCTGGRLHMGISDQIDTKNMVIPPETLKFIHETVDGFLAEDMYLMMMKKLNHLQSTSTRIFRKHNPTRIFGYKGMASSRLNGPPWEKLQIPYGDQSPYYVVCGSAASLGTARHSQKWKDWGIFKNYTEEEIKKEIEDFVKPALEYSKKTGTPVMIDHWTAGLHTDNVNGEIDLEAMKNSRSSRERKNYDKIMGDKTRAEKRVNPTP